MAKMTERQLKVCEEGKKGEATAEQWLTEHGFKILKSFSGKSHAGYFDIKCKRGKSRWIIEVKTGERPQIDIGNFEKMTKERGFDKIGLALVTKEQVHLLEYKKMTLAGYKAAQAKSKDGLSKAAKKAWKTRTSQALSGTI